MNTYFISYLTRSRIPVLNIEVNAETAQKAIEDIKTDDSRITIISCVKAY